MPTQKHPNLTVNTPVLNAHGFTLIEIMIVVAIIGILSSIAIPQYFSYVQKTRRADAQVALMLEMQTMERCRASTFTYVGCEVSNINSPESHYRITVNTTATGYTLRARGRSNSPQSGDSECRVMRITSQGIRSPSPSTTACWPN